MEIIKEIKKYAQAYYEGDPLITDEEFDRLTKKLKQDDPNNILLLTIGWGYFPEPGKVKSEHLVGPVGSLDKIKYDDIDGIDGLDCEDVLMMPKLDGGSFVCYYKNGVLSQILSRGNGIIGVDVTKNMYHAVPSRINTTENLLAIRGEGVITLEDFNQEIFIDLSHPRNAAVGLTQALIPDPEKLKYVRFVAYSVLGQSSEDNYFLSKDNQLNFLIKNKFETVPKYIVSKEEIETIVNEDIAVKVLTQSMDEKTYPIDGLVLANPSGFFIKHKSGYFTIDNPSLAYKFEDETALTTVTNIEWNLSGTGRMVPLLNVKTVNLDGANISKVTANNYEWLFERQAGIGSSIEIIRANQVVPKLIQTIWPSDDLNLPEFCPECSNRLERIGVDLACSNKFCIGKMKGIIKKVWEYIKPDGASDATFDLMLSKFKKDEPIISEFKYFLRERTISSSENHYENLLYSAVQNYKKSTVTLTEVLAQANIPAIGRRLGSRIENDIKSVDEFISYLNKGFPNTVFKYEILNEYLNNIIQSYYIWEGKIKMKSADSPYIRVAVTGALSIPRDQWYKKMEIHGIVKSGITKNTKYLVCNNPSNSNKFKKAKEYGIEVISEEDFNHLFTN